MIFMVGDILYFNPRSPYGERPSRMPAAVLAMRISIHAPLTGSDGPGDYMVLGTVISIHAPLTGSDAFVPPELTR